METLQTYLEKYASHRLARYSLPADLSFDVAVVLPLRAENALFPACLSSLEHSALLCQKKVLLLPVLNHRISDTAEFKESGRQHLKNLLGYRGPLTLLPIDCVHTGFEFPEKQGVGLARKIGCDLALDLFSKGNLLYPHIFTTDGDALVPPDYFDLDSSSSAARLHLFRHLPCGENSIDAATELYEKWLRYYVLGLRHAGSPYAFQTVGSLLSVSYRAYATVRGFPQKEAGEDFYLLNKLAKVGKISTRPKMIALRSRASDRVPFGTGRGVLEILSLAHPDQYTFYDPKIFSILKEWLQILTRFSEERHKENAKQALFRCLVQHSPTAQKADFSLFWEKMGFDPLLEGADKTRPKKETCLRHLHTEFDAFRTLKFIHWVRDLFLPNLKPDDALKSAVFTQGRNQLQELQSLEEDLTPLLGWAGGWGVGE